MSCNAICLDIQRELDNLNKETITWVKHKPITNNLAQEVEFFLSIRLRNILDLFKLDTRFSLIVSVNGRTLYTHVEWHTENGFILGFPGPVIRNIEIRGRLSL